MKLFVMEFLEDVAVDSCQLMLFNYIVKCTFSPSFLDFEHNYIKNADVNNVMMSSSKTTKILRVSVSRFLGTASSACKQQSIIIITIILTI